jgi:hypothetical protein
MLLLGIKLLASWMAMQGTTKFLWQWKIYQRQPSDVLGIFDYLSGLS